MYDLKVKEEVMSNYKYLVSDVVFKYIFGIQKNKRFTVKLLSVLLDMPESAFKNIKIINSLKLTPDTIINRKFESDIVIMAEDLDFIINLESQLIYDKPARNKNNAYAYKLSSSQFKSGKGGDKSVKKVIQINLVKEFVGVGNLEGEYELSDIKLQKKQKDELIEIRVNYIEKYKRLLYNEHIEERELLLALLSVDSEEEIKLVKEKAKRFPVIKELIEDMEKFQSEEYVQELYWNDYVVKARERQAKEDGFNDGFNDGFDNGKDIGYNERNYEVARNLILNDVSTNIIVKSTGLSLKEINKLKKSLKTY